MIKQTINMLVICLFGVFTFSEEGFSLDLDSIFTPYSSVLSQGTTLRIGGIRYNNKYYWGEWELGPDINFTLKRAGEVNDINFFNMERACTVIHNSTEVDEAEVRAIFDNLDGCERYKKYTKSDGSLSYCCIGKNFVKLLGTSGATNSKYEDFYLPLYLDSGASFSGKMRIKPDNGQEFDVFYTMMTIKEGDKWIERFYMTFPTSYIIYLREFNVTDYSLVSSKVIKGSIE